MRHARIVTTTASESGVIGHIAAIHVPPGRPARHYMTHRELAAWATRCLGATENAYYPLCADARRAEELLRAYDLPSAVRAFLERVQGRRDALRMLYLELVSRVEHPRDEHDERQLRLSFEEYPWAA